MKTVLGIVLVVAILTALFFGRKIIMSIMKTVAGGLLTGIAVLGALFLGAFVYGALGPSIPLRFVVFGGIYLVGMVYCVLRMTANYRGESKKFEFGKVNGSFWMLVAMCLGFLFLSILVVSRFGTSIPLALLLSAACVAVGGLLWKVWFGSCIKLVGVKRRGVILFQRTRLGTIGTEYPRIYRWAKKFMPESFGEGWHVVLTPFFRISDEADQTSLEKERHDFAVVKATPDKVENSILFTLSGLRVSPDYTNVFMEYASGWLAIKKQLAVIITNKVGPYILTKKADTPQTWEDLKECQEEVTRIAVQSLLEKSGCEFSDEELKAEVGRVMGGEEFEMPRFGIFVGQVLVEDIKADPKIEQAARRKPIEDLERAGDLEDARTHAMQAGITASVLFGEVEPDEAFADPERRELLLALRNRHATESLVADDHRGAFIVEGDGSSPVAQAGIIAQALGGGKTPAETTPTNAANPAPNSPPAASGKGNARKKRSR